jgi:AcrR family transcriptional regulator
LDQAFRLAARDGLEGLSLSALAGEIGMSKSGLFAHFKSKEALQVALLEQAQRTFETEVWSKVVKAPRGEPRIKKLFDTWIAWVDQPSLPGGCLFMAASAELDDHEGPPRDVLVAGQRNLLDAVAKAARLAVNEGHFDKKLDCDQFAFELQGILFSYNHYRRLLADRSARSRAQRAFDALLARSRKSR